MRLPISDKNSNLGHSTSMTVQMGRQQTDDKHDNSSTIT